MRSRNKKTKFDIVNWEPHIFVLVGLCLLVVGIGLSAYRYISSYDSGQFSQTAGRTGSNCGFAGCTPEANASVVLHERYGFSFAYPEGFEVSESQNNIIAQNHRGHIWVQVINKQLNPDTISGMYGPVDASEVTEHTINAHKWYEFSFGDEECGGPQYQTALRASILAVSFITCNEDRAGGGPPVAEDQDVIAGFLSSFKAN